MATDRDTEAQALPSDLEGDLEAGVERGLAAGYGGRQRARDEVVPTVLGEYRILREIGRGAMGVVYLAKETSLDRLVALKVLPAHLTLQGQMIERFRQEASSVAQLRHPGIVQIYQVGEHAGHHFFAMELLEGGSLHDVIEDLRGDALERLSGSRLGRAIANASFRIDETEAGDEAIAAVWKRPYVESVCRLVAQVATALQHAHEAGVVHRDVKPANIVARADGTAVLTDFGLARQEGQPHLTRTGVFVGTPHYTSPEQARGSSASLDPRSDVFSLGVTLYELLTLRRPFEGTSSVQVLDRIARQEPVNPRRINRRLPLDLATITLKALEKEPNRRYASAGALAADLEAFLRFESISARPASIPSRMTKFVRRHRAASASVVLLGVAALATWAWWWSQKVRFRVESATDGAIVFLDGEAVGGTNEDLFLEPGEYVMRVAKPPELFSLAQEIALARGERQVNRIELVGFDDFRDDLLVDGQEAPLWLEQGVPAAFRSGIEDALARRARRHVELLAQSDFEGAGRIEDEIGRLDRLDPERVATASALERRARGEEVDRRARALYDEATAGLEHEDGLEDTLAKVHALQRMRFEGLDHQRSQTDARQLTEELARRLAERVENALEERDSENAGKSLALLESVDRSHPQLPSLETRLARVRREERLASLRSEAALHADPGSADPVRLEEILEELRRLSAGGDAIAEVEGLIVAARFERWLQGSRVEAAVASAIASGSVEELDEQVRRLSSASDLARPRLEDPPLARFASLKRAVAVARDLVAEVASLGPDPDDARRRAEQLRNVPLPPAFAGARDDLLDELLERVAARESCDALLASCRRDLSRLRLAEARAGLDELRSSASRLSGGDAIPVATEIDRAESDLKAALEEEATLIELTRPFELFLAPPHPLESADSDRGLQTLHGRTALHRRRLASAIEVGPDDAHTARLLLRRAELALAIGDWKGALDDARRAVDIEASTAGRVLVGRALYVGGVSDDRPSRLEEARATLERAAAAADCDPRVHYWRAMCVRALASDPSSEVAAAEAVRLFEAALEPARGDQAEIHYELALTHFRIANGVTPDVRAAEREAVVRHANQALDALDATSERLLEMEDVEVFLETVRRIRRDALILRGRAYADGKRWRAAVSTFQEATRVDETHGLTWLRLANAATGITTDESYYEAIEYLRKVELYALGDESLLAAAKSLRRSVDGWLRGER